MASKYAHQGFDTAKMARALGRDLPISTKQAIEICKHLNHRSIDDAKTILENVTVKADAIPFTRFTNGLGHRKGDMATGRFPVKAAEKILSLVQSAESNAHQKGLGELEIVHMCAHRASAPVHPGRQRGRVFKRTHVEVVVQETKPKKKAAKKGADAKTETAKPKEEKAPEKTAPSVKEQPAAKPAEKQSQDSPKPAKEDKPVQKETTQPKEDNK